MTVSDHPVRRTVAEEFRVLTRKLDIIDRKIAEKANCGDCVRKWTVHRRSLERQLLTLVRSDTFQKRWWSGRD